MLYALVGVTYHSFYFYLEVSLMRFLKIATAAIALACVTSVSVFAKPPVASPSPCRPENGQDGKNAEDVQNG